MKMIKNMLPYIGILIAVVLIRILIVTPVRVSGSSMDPTLKNNDIILLQKFDRKYQYGDIVILNYNRSKLVKRIIGVPGDHIEYKQGKLYINQEEVEDPYSLLTNNFRLEDLFDFKTIPEGYYFVLGDNRKASSDSRMIGLISKKEILGTVRFRLFPFQTFGSVK